MPGRIVRVNVPLDVAEVGLHDRHVVFQLQALVQVSLQTFGRLFVIYQTILAAGRVQGVQLVDNFLLHKVSDEEDQKRHAVRIVLAEADPLGKLGAEPLPV